MTNNSLGSNFQNGATQLGKAPRLNMVDSLKPLSQRQALVKIHDSLFLLLTAENQLFDLYNIDASTIPQDAKSLRFWTFLQVTNPTRGSQGAQTVPAEPETITRTARLRKMVFLLRRLKAVPGTSGKSSHVEKPVVFLGKQRIAPEKAGKSMATKKTPA
jgi:hypothetical protein